MSGVGTVTYPATVELDAKNLGNPYGFWTSGEGDNSYTYIAGRDLVWYQGLMRIKGPVHHRAFAHAFCLPGDPSFHFLHFPWLIRLSLGCQFGSHLTLRFPDPLLCVPILPRA